MKSLKYFFFLFLVPLVLSGCCTQTSNPKVLMKTELGNITLELYPDKAPLTVANFLKYIEESRLNDATFYRTVSLDNQPDNKVKIEVIQGGLYEDNHPQMLAPIPHENTKTTGILHKDGVISMARNEPGTATCEFFICVGDQPSLDYGGNRNSDGQGFAAFGKVIDGMDVVRKIQQSNAEGQWLTPRIKIIGVNLVE
ncbi:MAG: peptidylprolyl isomerase [Bacteroidales bacterium]|nr:peptidylprolyl isomerase [Bacteroidales bacterium]